MPISTQTKRLLLAKSGGYCQNPECNTDLFTCFENGKVTNIEELAHIIAQKKKGPRGKIDTTLSNKDEYDNVILLCPTCHTKIDKNPDIYSADLLRKWKVKHEEKIKSNFHIPTYQKRSDLRPIVIKLLAENNAIFNHYGPQSDFAMSSTQSEAAKMWNIKSIDTIIPNNRKICELLDKNYSLLDEKERKIVGEFQIHKEGFEYNKLSGDKNPTVPLFPQNIYNILNN